MLIYETTKKEFLEKVKDQSIFTELEKEYAKKDRKAGYKITNSWNGSLPYMYILLEDERIPDNCGISIEHGIPNIDQDKKIDFIITGYDQNKEKVAITIEIKQWTTIKEPADKIGYIVSNYTKKEKINGEEKITYELVPHPSYQVWSYAFMLNQYNEEAKEIKIYPCVFLHNYDKKQNDVLDDKRYEKYIKQAPYFYKGEIKKFQDYICDKIKYGDNQKIIELIENSKETPSSLLQYETKDIKKYSNFAILIDEQQIVHDKVIQMAQNTFKDNKKRVLIVKGGPGTGKTILAIKMMLEFLEEGKENIKYICPIPSAREIYSYLLKKNKKSKKFVQNMESGANYIKYKENELDITVIDEAHRLKENYGQYDKKGKNQVKEIINASKVSIFFIDELQRISTKDIGSVEEIRKNASKLGAEVEELKLTSQFRCYGSSDYIYWLEDVLQIRENDNFKNPKNKINYEIKIIETPNELDELIKKKNNVKNKKTGKIKNASRLVAGYCWDSKKEARNDPKYYDIDIPEYNFKKSWNLQKDKKWAIGEGTVEQAGCIYTCLGLEFEYVGVIIGKDLVYRNGNIEIDYTQKPRSDNNALYGLKTKLRKKSGEEREKAYKQAMQIIKNTYRTLMTRGQKGCYIFCYDDELKEYLKKRIKDGIQ